MQLITLMGGPKQNNRDIKISVTSSLGFLS